MDKEALLNIILSEIHEVETLIKSFQDKTNISSAFLNLTEKKLNSLLEEVKLLESFSNDGLESASNKSTSNDNLIIEHIAKKAIDNLSIEEVKEETEENPMTTSGSSVVPVKEKTNPIIPPIVEEESQTPKQEPITETAKSDELKSDKLIIGETLGQNIKSLNENIGYKKEDKSSKFIGKRIDDLTKGIGLNDRFFYQRELFDDNVDLMNKTLAQLNDMPNFDSAISFLMANFDWPRDSDAEQSFFDYLRRKFI